MPLGQRRLRNITVFTARELQKVQVPGDPPGGAKACLWAGRRTLCLAKLSQIKSWPRKTLEPPSGPVSLQSTELPRASVSRPAKQTRLQLPHRINRLRMCKAPAAGTASAPWAESSVRCSGASLPPPGPSPLFTACSAAEVSGHRRPRAPGPVPAGR